MIRCNTAGSSNRRLPARPSLSWIQGTPASRSPSPHCSAVCAAICSAVGAAISDSVYSRGPEWGNESIHYEPAHSGATQAEEGRGSGNQMMCTEEGEGAAQCRAHKNVAGRRAPGSVGRQGGGPRGRQPKKCVLCCVSERHLDLEGNVPPQLTRAVPQNVCACMFRRVPDGCRRLGEQGTSCLGLAAGLRRHLSRKVNLLLLQRGNRQASKNHIRTT
jgi:hypothetical protein